MKPLYIFDLDGTIANIDHRLHFVRGKRGEDRNWKAFNKAMVEDMPNEWIVGLMHRVQANGDILILSGRSEENGTRERTEWWLEEHSIPCDYLRMRLAGDYRKDEVIKKEMLDAFLSELFAYKYEVQFIVDDRQRVVDMWRREGYNVFQCNAWEEQVDWVSLTMKTIEVVTKQLDWAKEVKDIVGDGDFSSVASDMVKPIHDFLKENFKIR